MTQSHPLFPISLAANWQSADYFAAHFSLSAELGDWLLDPTSLTKRLTQHCENFSVELLGQQVELCSADEATAEIHAGEQVLVREVLLYCDEQPQVFARSLMPLASLTGEEQKLASLGDQSLGQVIFSNPALVRKGIELSAFNLFDNEDNRLAELVASLNLPKTEQIFGRRSVFLLNNKPLMVAEVFLPQAFAYQSVNP